MKTTIPVLENRLDQITALVDVHNKLLVTGEGPDRPALPERVRDIERVFREVGFWLRAIALLFAGQFVVVLFALLYGFVRILPALMQLSESGGILRILMGN